MNLVLLYPNEIDGDNVARLHGTRVAHMRNVLKLQAGDSVRIGILDGPKGTGTVSVIHQDEVVLQCVWNSETPGRPRIDLLLALPRPKVMKRLWAQLAALGIGRIILTNAWKVERNYFDTHVLGPAFYRPRLIEGLQQASDTHLPEVSIHKQFKVLVEDKLDELCPAGVRVVAHPGSKKRMSDISGSQLSGERILLAVGPEGGWMDYELKLLETHRFKPVGMGERILRTDTACVALLAVLHENIRTEE